MVNLTKLVSLVKTNSMISSLVIISFAGLAFSAGLETENMSRLIKDSFTIPTSTPVPVQITPTDMVEITEEPTSKPIAKKTVDTDPIVNCGVSTSCGGGSKHLKKSVCEKSVCCQVIPNGSFVFYENRDKCNQDQNLAKNSNKTNKNIGTQTNYQQIKISCSYSSGSYYFNYGMLTYDECKKKSDEYWEKKRQEIQNSGQTVNIPDNSPEDIDYTALYAQCRDSVMSEYNSVINQLNVNGAADSSAGQQAVAARDSGLADCNNRYGN